jgi:hypothetical protein
MKTTDEILDALRWRHPEAQGEWIFMREPWRIDALAVRCWLGKPGLRWIAYEVKASWNDLQRELSRSEKRQRAVAISDQFYFVMPLALAERMLRGDGLPLPIEAGLLVATKYGCRELVRAPLRERRPLTDHELVELLRFRHNPAARRLALQQADRSESWNEHLNERLGQLRRELDEAHQRLAGVAGHTVGTQTFWRGTWPARAFPPRDEVPDAEVEVVGLHAYGTRKMVDVVYDGDKRTLGLGEFLAGYVPVAARAEVV